MANKFITVMEAIGRDIKKAWTDVVPYLPAASALASLLFPGSAQVAGVVNSVSLIEQAVTVVEQKFVAAGSPSGSGAQKLAQVLSIVTPTVTQLLAQEGIAVNQTQVTNIVNAVVAVLNVSPAPAVKEAA